MTGIGGKDLIGGSNTSRADLRGDAAMVALGNARVLLALQRMANGASSNDHLASSVMSKAHTESQGDWHPSYGQGAA